MMKRRSSLIQQSLVMILALCMSLSIAGGAAGFSQAGGPGAASPADLDKLLAPVALYPDALLMQVLAASVNSQEVLDGGNWLLQNNTLQGDQLDSASKSAGFGAAMMALFHFPQVIDMMCSEIDWTRQVGAAFSADQSAVLDSVQRLRAQAQQAGNLKTTPQQTVVTQQASGQQVIVIQPANPQIIYVPQYNPVQVYVAPAPNTAAVALVAFGTGLAIGAMFSSNNYYYPRWGPGGGCYYGGRVWVSHSYVYRPVYGPHYHRATVYYRPPSYKYAYNKPYPGNTHYNSSNYYNNYRGNSNNQNKSNNTINRNVSGNNVTINTGNQVNNSGNKTKNTAVNNGNNQTNQNWKGQSTYNGANKSTTNSSNSATKNSPSTYPKTNSSAPANARSGNNAQAAGTSNQHGATRTQGTTATKPTSTTKPTTSTKPAKQTKPAKATTATPGTAGTRSGPNN
jgi:hypothetical protein